MLKWFGFYCFVLFQVLGKPWTYSPDTNTGDLTKLCNHKRKIMAMASLDCKPPDPTKFRKGNEMMQFNTYYVCRWYFLCVHNEKFSFVRLWKIIEVVYLIVRVSMIVICWAYHHSPTMDECIYQC